MPEADEITGKISLDASNFMSGMSSLMEKVNSFTALLGFGVGVTAFVELGKAAISAASDVQQSEVLFAQALGTVGVSYDSVSESAARYFKHLEEISGFQRDELEKSTTRLIQITQDYEVSLKLVAIATDMARGTGKSLAETTLIIGRAYEGQMGALRRAGVVLDKHTSSIEALNTIQKRFAGDGAAYMETYAGHVTKWQNLWHEFEVTFGKKMITALDMIADGFLVEIDAIKLVGKSLELAILEPVKILIEKFPAIRKFFDKDFVESVNKTATSAISDFGDMRKHWDSMWNPVDFDKKTKKIAESVNDMARKSSASIDHFGDTLKNISEDFLKDFGKNFSSAFQLFEKGTFDMVSAFKKAIDQMVQKILDSLILNFIGLLLPGSVAPTGFGLLGNLFGGKGNAAAINPSAMGNVFSGGNVVPFAQGGLIPGPISFPLANGQTGMAGERGPEAVVPLVRTGSGQLGVKTEGSGDTHIHVMLNDQPILSAIAKASRTGRLVIHPTAIRTVAINP